MRRADFADADTTMIEVQHYLEHDFGVVCLGKLGFENAYALAMTRKRAGEWGARTIADLGRHRPLKVGGDTGVLERKERQLLKEKYGLRDEDVQPVAMAETLMYEALGNGNSTPFSRTAAMPGSR